MNESNPRRRWIPGGIGIALLVVVAYSVFGSCPPSVSEPPRREIPPDGTDRDSTPPIACPDGYEAEPDEATRILSVLRRTSGGPLLGGHPPVQLCFGSPHPPGVTPGGVLLLDRATGTTENSARVAHLLVHLTEGAPFDEDKIGGQECSQLVVAAVRAEARAFAMEVAVRESLGVTTPDRAFGFEPDIYRTPPPDRIEEILEFLLAHPAGAENIVGYVDLYTEKCERRSRHQNARAPE